MTWKQEIQLRDLDLNQSIEITCNYCNRTYYERPSILLKQGDSMRYVYLNEIFGRSPYAPPAFGAQAPDSGNAEILWQFGTPEQQKQWMEPLVNCEISSCFSMTEPDVSGADPTGLQTTAVRDGDDWVINGHKWFTSGGLKASFAIVMCVPDPEAPTLSRMSQIIVPTDAPGFNIIRPIPVMGDTEGHHCEIAYEDVRVPITNTLGEPCHGFRIAQRRLGPGRIHLSLIHISEPTSRYAIS